MQRIRFYFLVAFLGASIPACAQLPDVRFEIITSKDGLPSNTVYSAIRDHKGFMWFGTRLYPVRYDGASFQSFKNPKTGFVAVAKAIRERII